ncbi:hypothetical protein BJ166DRAFT_262751 [Pestalotiopsis sp. NC0098]|nr:hypothetical protein BJ166DRAFT_262751 [Pestalotiopsis sp. NC0098]
MQDREDRIADPHESTFKWIFEKSSDEKWISLREWLESDDKLYWVTGIPGSGKSTIMRYISRPVSGDDEQSPRSRSYRFLRRGAGTKRLLIATFYFWNSGLQMQTTQRGLLMTLLRQILEELPDLLPLVSPTRWENLCLFGRVPNWGDTELRELLLLCVKNLEHFDTTAAFFVDGLDEFQGEPKELISMFQEMRSLPYNKLCVASRPWNEFKDAFGKEPSLMVEQLTRDDIKHFVAARFDSDLKFTQLPSQELDQLIEDIVTKASGVFLWVSLVVSSLISGMGNGDRIIDLRKRFDLLPPDLSKLYKKMIQSLDPFYLEHAAQLFALVGASREPMNLLLASFVDEEDPQFALRMEFKIMSDQEIEIRMDAMRRRINSRSRGLLEVKGGKSAPQGISYNASSYKDVTVQYLHRTVKDFVESPDVQQTLRDALKAPFDPHLRFLAGRLAYLKSMRTSILPRGGAGIHRTEKYVIECFSIAREVQAQSNVPMIHLLDNLLKVCSSITTTPYLREHCEGGRFGGTFLSLAAACNVVEYVRAKATSPCLIQRTDQTQWPLLMDAMFGHVAGGSLSDFAESDPTVSIRERYRATIEVLLEKGADPKYEMIHKTWAGQDNSPSPLVEAAKLHMTYEDGLSLVAVQLLSRHNTFDTSTLDSIILGYFSLKGIIYPNKKRLADFLARRAIKKVIGKALEDTAKGTPPDFVEVWRQLISTHKLTPSPRYERAAWLEAKKNRRREERAGTLAHCPRASVEQPPTSIDSSQSTTLLWSNWDSKGHFKNVEVSRR